MQSEPRRELLDDLTTAKCPSCGTSAAEHQAAECLDRWIHQEFLGRVLAADEAVPPYSRSPRQACLDVLIGAPKWVEGAAVMQTIAGCSIGILLREDGAYEHYRIVATSGSLPLAICRAAVCGLAGGGANPLVIK